MRTTLWEERFGSFALSRVSYAWSAGETLREVSDMLTLKHAEARRPVKARLSEACGKGSHLGRVVLTPPETCVPVEAVQCEDNFLVRIFHFDPDWLNRQVCDDLAYDFHNLHFDPSFDNPLIAATLERIYDEVTARRSGWQDVVDMLVRLLSADMARLLRARAHAHDGGDGRDPLTPDQLALIQQVLASVHVTELSPDHVARATGMNIGRLRDAFRQTTGKSLRDEIEAVRMEQARLRLQETRLPLKIIAHEMGFAHASGFCHAFKKTTGMTPTEFRQQSLQGGNLKLH